MLGHLHAAARHISEMHKKISESAAGLRDSKTQFSDFLESQLFVSVSPLAVDGMVCAVDGGLLAQEMHGIDIIMGRAIAVNFNYKNSKLSGADYFPLATQNYEYDVKIGLDEHEIMLYRTLFRLDLEISTAISAIEKFKPKILLLDGSIVPLTTDRPAEKSEEAEGSEDGLFSKYSALIEKYVKLYDSCAKNNVLLVGITKDSRGRRFMDIVKKEVPHRWSDSLFLNSFLKGKERTSALKYSAFSARHAVLKDLGGHADSICLFYIKCSSEDRPLRVEFLQNPNYSFSEIASAIYSLSAISKSYAYPAALIEADMRATMNPIEIERAQKTLMMLSNVFQPLRRNSRPFR